MLAASSGGPTVLRLSEVRKQFGAVVAADGLSIEFAGGQVHAVLGANGSGKSTMVRLVTGVHQPDSGVIELGGRTLAAIASPAEAFALGVRVVHQEAPLIDTMTITETVAIFRGFGVPALGFIGWRRLRRGAAELLEQVGIAASPEARCSELSAGDRAGLALAIAVADLFEAGTGDGGTSRAGTPGPVKLLIADEVTAAINEADAELHLRRIRSIADRGVAVLMITHRLAELRIADDVSILRSGRVVYHQGEGPRRGDEDLVAEMVGTSPGAQAAPVAGSASRPVARLWAATSLGPAGRGWARHPVRRAGPVTAGTGAPVLAMRAVVAERLNGLSFEAGAGEVVGFVGLKDSGLTEIPEVLSGERPWRSGTLSVNDRTWEHSASPLSLIDAGVAVIPSDRLRRGGVGSLSVDENIVLPSVWDYWGRRDKRRATVRGVIEGFDVRPPDPRQLFGVLSGGNQQKVLLGKWLALRPALLVLDDPTYGVDPHARETIFAAALDAAEQGVCVLFLSSEPEQLLRVCSRVLVVHEGRTVTELAGPAMTLEKIMEWSFK